MRIEDFDYDLPEALIAQHPVEPRDASRLMVMDRASGEISHHIFHEITQFLDERDFLIFNDTRVIPARIYGSRRPDGGGKAEVLLLRPMADGKWEALVRPGRKLRPGSEVFFGHGQGRILLGETTEFGGRIICFPDMTAAEMDAAIHRWGEMPLPPYIHEPLADKERYQTVYAKEEGSAAAPTAGLHFTPELLERLRQQGVKTGFLTLHVGLGTFRPVTTERIEDHQMHSEFYRIGDTLAEAVNRHRAAGGRIIAVGTTSVRALESAADADGHLPAKQGWTDIFITPGYRFKIIDGIITNFHLPRSTLLMLISALAGRERILAAYREAVQEKYRFFSFGDAMLIR